MAFSAVRGAWASLGLLVALGCSLGGQTYDDGSDEVRRTTGTKSPDVGAPPSVVSPSEPNPADAGESPQRGPGDNPEPTDAGGLRDTGTSVDPAPSVSGGRKPDGTNPGPASDDAGVPLDPEAICAALDAQQGEAVAKLTENPDVSCQMDSDCVTVQTELACEQQCPSGVIVNREAAASIEQAIANQSDELCPKRDAAGCSPGTLDCTEFDPALVRCQAGSCSYATGVCDDVRSEATSAIAKATDAVEVGCLVDADCKGMELRSCVDACGSVVVGRKSDILGLQEQVDNACEATAMAHCSRQEECVLIDLSTDSFCNQGVCAPGLRRQDCYDPEQNLDQAYSGSLDGCACNDEGAFCGSGVALQCTDGSWTAVEDGACSITDLACDGRLDSARACVQLFDACVLLDTGRYCGIGPRTQLCEGGYIAQSESDCPQDAACIQLDNGLWCSGATAATP
ncbi:MAG TPA: hypothetical protein VHM70_23730 [Polyangiaceae bacterium]|nr:hypothetical protein [Polyangiaceae bacterium]